MRVVVQDLSRKSVREQIGKSVHDDAVAIAQANGFLRQPLSAAPIKRRLSVSVSNSVVNQDN
jgi:hypothetical protein